MSISILWGVALVFFLIAIVLYINYAFRLQMFSRVLRGIGRFTLSLLAVGLLIALACAFDKLWLTLFLTLLIILAESLLAVGRGKFKLRLILLPVLAGMSAATLVVASVVALWVTSLRHPFSAHIFLPIVGILTGSLAGVLCKSLRVYFMGLEHHRQLYDYLLGNGCTHRQAVDYFVRRALQSAVSSVLRQVGVVSAFMLPICAFSLVMAGIDVVSSVMFEIVICVSVFAASLLSLLVTLLVARRMSFDDYGRFKPVS